MNNLQDDIATLQKREKETEEKLKEMETQIAEREEEVNIALEEVQSEKDARAAEKAKLEYDINSLKLEVRVSDLFFCVFLSLCINGLFLCLSFLIRLSQ